MIRNRVELIDQETLRIRGSRGMVRGAADAASARTRPEWVDLSGSTLKDAAAQPGGDAVLPQTLAECLVPALRVLSHQVERLEEELSLVRKERDAERARVAMLARTLEKARNGTPVAKAQPSAGEASEGVGQKGGLGDVFPRLSTRQKQVLDLIAQGKCTKEIARQLNLGIGTVKVHMSALYSALGVSSRSAALAASYHQLSRLEQAREAATATAA